MSRYPLHDIAGTLAAAPDLDSAIGALITYLRALHADWHPTVALIEPEHQRVESVWYAERGRLEKRDIVIPLEHLPARLVRKFVQPSAFFTAEGRRSLLEKLFRTSGAYEPDQFESRQLQALTAPVVWRSCLCLPLNDRHELLGLLVLVCPQANVFGSQVEEALQPLRGLASLAIARRLHAAGRVTPETREREQLLQRSSHAMKEQVRQLQAEIERLTGESEARGATLQALMREVEALRTGGSANLEERRRYEEQAAALEAQVMSVGQHMSEAFTQLAEEQSRASELQDTLEIVREAFDVIAGDPDAGSLTRKFVGWFCDRFQVGRCSLMRVDEGAGDLRIMACRGLDPVLAERVRVGMGQGVSGWVAHHRLPVLVSERAEAAPVRPTGLDRYDSDSFMSLPLVHRSRVVGVLNLANKQGGESFDRLDLDRAQLASHVLAVALGVAREHSVAGQAA